MIIDELLSTNSRADFINDEQVTIDYIDDEVEAVDDDYDDLEGVDDGDEEKTWLEWS